MSRDVVVLSSRGPAKQLGMLPCQSAVHKWQTLRGIQFRLHNAETNTAIIAPHNPLPRRIIQFHVRVPNFGG